MKTTETSVDGKLRNYFQRFLETGAYCAPPGRSACALTGARTLLKWEELESAGLVRLRAEPESDSYFDVYGEPDSKRERESIVESIERDGCWCVVAEYLDDQKGTWQHADSIGMCVGYSDPTSPWQNCYVIDLMASAIGKIGQPGEH